MRKTIILCLAAAAWLAAIGSGTIPGTSITYDHILEASDSGSINSLMTGTSSQNWSDGYTIQEGDESVVLYVPEGLGARTASSVTTTIVPVIYCAGRVYLRASAGYTTTFNDLRLLDGGWIDCQQVGYKAGNITILATDPDNPAKFDFARSSGYSCRWRARVSGSADSQLLYCNSVANYGALELQSGSDWSDFYGTLCIEGEGLGILTTKNVPITIPGTVKIGNGGFLFQFAMDLKIGNLFFSNNVIFTNQVSGTSFTVPGTFDTGTNCYWRAGYPVTVGTLILGDGLVFHESKATPQAVVTVTNRLEVGENITLMYNNVSYARAPVLFMKLSPAAVSAGVPDLSGVKVDFDEGGYEVLKGCLTTEPDPDDPGGLLVYATRRDPLVIYNGPDEFAAGSSAYGQWIDPVAGPPYWSDGLFPDDPGKIYANTQTVYLTSSHPVFPGKVLYMLDEIYIRNGNTSYYVTNLVAKTTGLYPRSTNIHLGGNLYHAGDTDVNLRFRCFLQGNFYLDSVMHGEGGWIFESYYPTTDGGATVYLTADNSDWTGRCQTRWSKRKSPASPDADETLHTKIVVGDAKSLGGNPASFICNAMILWDYGELRFTNTTVQAASNRGFLVTNGIIRVDSGMSVRLTAPVTVKGTFRKVGAGTLDLGGGLRWAANDDLSDATAPGEGENIVLVKEGAIKGTSLDRADVTFSDGTGIIADDSRVAMDLTAATVTAEGDIYLGADEVTAAEPEDGIDWPVVKVTAAQAETFGTAFKLKPAPWRGWKAELVSGSDGSGNVIYSIRYAKPGILIMFY